MLQPLVTQRLVLRRLETSDAEAVYAYRAAPEVSRYQSWEPASAEEIRALIGFPFTQTETHRVYSSVDPRNRSCLRLLQKIGMRQEAHMVESLWIKGTWADDLVFGILKNEWKKLTDPRPLPATRTIAP